MYTKLKEKMSVYIAKSPSEAILILILLFNIAFLFLSALIICMIAQSDNGMGFWATLYYVITMILDAGCISFILDSMSQTSLLLNIVCILVVLIGMISFTGSVIGYITNYISSFIEDSKAGKNRLYLSNHTIILNWNSRASEIVNDLLYLKCPQTVIVLVESGKEQIENEIRNRLSETMDQEEEFLRDAVKDMPWSRKRKYILEHRVKNRLTVIVREGDVYSAKQLKDIAVESARSVILLHRDSAETAPEVRGNTEIIKTLITVSDIVSSLNSADEQRIVVEVDDEWTMNLVNKIIEHKKRSGKCNIVPIPINRVLGQILSQFSIMPELNYVYSELFSNRGGYFESAPLDQNICSDEAEFVESYLQKNNSIIPLTVMDTEEGRECFYITTDDEKFHRNDRMIRDHEAYQLNPDFRFKKKNIIILGHNSNMKSIMEGFSAFCSEWKNEDGTELLDITMIDDRKHLQYFDHYRGYSYVRKTVEADIYNQKAIHDAIMEIYQRKDGDISILILSDDSVGNEETDAKALTYLIYVQDIIRECRQKSLHFDSNSITVIVEVLNPKNYDVVRSYSINNVVISKRYVSKMITQIGEKKAIFDFYNDILTYDESINIFDSKELYIKKAADFFRVMPEGCSAETLIRGIYYSSPENNRSIVLGYVKEDGQVVFFFGNQSDIIAELKPTDKLILFSAH